MGSLVAYGFLAYLLTRITPAHFPRRAAIALLAGLVLLIGFSRIYLGVHFMSDVIGGYAAGGCLAHVLYHHDPPDASPPARIPNPAWPEAPAGISSPHSSRSPQGPSAFIRQNFVVGKLPRRPCALP